MRWGQDWGAHPGCQEVGFWEASRATKWIASDSRNRVPPDVAGSRRSMMVVGAIRSHPELLASASTFVPVSEQIVKLGRNVANTNLIVNKDCYKRRFRFSEQN